jgi:prepilin-type N-terminal cleavage/methylation domain-containing protein
MGPEPPRTDVLARSRRHDGQRGFTLVELLVVIAVLAVLATIVIFNVTTVVDGGRNSACATDIKSIQTASDAYFSENNNKYPTASGAPGTVDPSLLAGTYIHASLTQIEANTGAVTLDANGTAAAATCPGA